ncbi:MAG: hypothetical protein A2Z16_11080 [Chloroflexi bacterium RBG_16_54_18]|nr:MAG: hypothetical protein A2Z16_11080 [Chloroflexi bacterium RBG_16_54_18]
MLNEAIQINPTVPFALYDRACIKALNPAVYSIDSALDDLAQAIQGDSSNKNLAAKDNAIREVSIRLG